MLPPSPHQPTMDTGPGSMVFGDRVHSGDHWKLGHVQAVEGGLGGSKQGKGRSTLFWGHPVLGPAGLGPTFRLFGGKDNGDSHWGDEIRLKFSEKREQPVSQKKKGVLLRRSRLKVSGNFKQKWIKALNLGFRSFKVTLGRSTYECNAFFHWKPHYTFPFYYILGIF